MQSKEWVDTPGGFDFQLRTRVLSGAGCVARVGDVVKAEGGTRALVVTDPGIVQAGHAETVRVALESAGVTASVFDAVRPNPTTLDVGRCVDAAKAHRADFFVGVGGGSSLDTAKGANFVLTNGGRMEDYWGVGKATQPMLPLVAVPTTSGTGSELQSFALIAREEDHQKMACGDKKAAARYALLDPTLTASMPHAVAACTGLDALAHAVETAVTKPRNPVSSMFSREAFRRVVRHLPGVLRGTDVGDDARSAMLTGAAFAGAAIENSMLGIAHSLANPLNARAPALVHGHIVGLLLPHVVRHNAEDAVVAALYRDLAADAGLISSDAPPKEGVAALVTALTTCLEASGLPVRLTECQVDPSWIPVMSEEAAGQWTAQFNPREVTAANLRELYEAAW